MTTILTQEQIEGLGQLVSVIDQAYRLYFANSDDGCHKSSEGAVSLHFGNYFDRVDGSADVTVGVYSYIFGSGRQKHYPSIEAALADAEEWLAEEEADSDNGHAETPGSSDQYGSEAQA